MVENTSTRLVARYIETKQYKKAIKASDAILKKQPEHGETLCMKGLTLSYLDRKEEAYELVRKGLKNDLRSHVCWHVYGLLYRQARDYFEAVKCYRNALRIDPDNIQILRDLSLLQIHRRDLLGFCETRKKLLQLKSPNKLNWIGYAIAEHLCKNYETTLFVLDSYEKTNKDEQTTPYDRSETLIYKATVLKEAERYEEALECLVKNEKLIVDKVGMKELKGHILVYLNRLDDAKTVFESLLEINSENHMYTLVLMACEEKFRGFWTFEGAKSSFPVSLYSAGTPVNGWLSTHKAKRVTVGQTVVKTRSDVYAPLRPLTDEEETQLCAFFDGHLEKYSRSDTLCRLVVFFLNASAIFEERIDKYLRHRLRKGVPSLFRMIRGLYSSPGKVDILDKLILNYIKNLEGESLSFDVEKDGEIEPPTSLLFTYMLAAQHYDILGDYDSALSYTEKGLNHTPTLVELYSLKGRILKHAGALEASFEACETGRTMDKADRFLNTESTKACFRLNEVEKGDEIVLLFSKETENSTNANLHDMQCMWYECHIGRAYLRKKELGMALKIYHETFRHFSDIAEDQFDFHNYCLRKTTLKTYLQMLRVQDRLCSHKFYRRAAKDALKIYFDLYDRKLRGEPVSAADQEKEMTVAERRKEKHKKKKQALKEQKQEDIKLASGGGGKKRAQADPDPKGEKLLEADSLEEAMKLVDVLVQNSGLWKHTHVLAFKCFLRMDKPLLCLRSLLRLFKLCGKSAYHYSLAPLTTQFVMKIELAKYSDTVVKVVLEHLAPLLDSEEAFADANGIKKAADKFFAKVEQKQTECGPTQYLVETVGNLRCMKHARKDDDDIQQHAKDWLKSAKRWMGTLKDFRKAASDFKDYKEGEAFLAKAHELFPLADEFAPKQPDAASA
eukprot:GEMP01010536.1.p1 GENE.GEMP01010536.1~~GEMP01010536.1.p1  ORF type:complete len:900 (+),score=202.52 GEMP01010536.1:140-2839(+)